MRASRYLFLFLAAVVMITQCMDLRAQFRRRDITTLTPADQLELRQLIMPFLTNTIIDQHANNTGTIHCENTLFLTWHRDYVEQLEAYLMTQNNGSKYVPLPKWIPTTTIPGAFFNNLVGPGSAVVAGWPLLVNQNINGFANFNFAPFTAGTLCTAYPAGNLTRACTGFSFGTALDNYARALERQHNFVHGDVGGVMNDAQHSPAAAIFWPWHGYIDDLYRYYECNCGSAPAKDLFMKDNAADVGDEPNTSVTNSVYWESPDIWVRQDADPFAGGKYQHEDDINRHENPEYKALGGNNYVYVRIRNIGCQPLALGEQVLHLYWSKWSPGVWQWPTDWTTLPQGSEITPGIGINVPALNPGEQTVIEVPWVVPDPALYPIDPHHFCLLARLVSTVDPMHTIEGTDVWVNTRENNNIAWRNVQVYDNDPFNIVGPGDDDFATFHVAATRANTQTARLVFDFDPNPALHATVDLGKDLYQVWLDGGRQGKGITALEGNRIQINEVGASIDNLKLAAGALYYPSVQVYTRLSDGGGRQDVKIGDVDLFRVIQYEAETDGEEKVTGGITVEVRNALSKANEGDVITEVQITQPGCPTSPDGSITLTVKDPTATTFWWSNDASTKDLTNIAAGTYTVYARSATTGLTEAQDIVVTSRSTLDATTDAVNAKCNLANGTAKVFATGGALPYTYQWYTADGTAIAGATGKDLANVAHGLYLVDVKDAAGCSIRRSIWVDEEMSMLEVYMSKGDVTSPGGKDGWAQADAVGMMEPFTYVWNTGASTEKIENLSAGIYSVTVTDAMGCSVSKQVEVKEPAGLIQGVDPNGATLGATILSIVPNPTSLEAAIVYRLDRGGNVRVELFDEVGKLVRFVEDGPKGAGENVTRIDTRQISSGRYSLRITFEGHVSSMPFVVLH